VTALVLLTAELALAGWLMLRPLTVPWVAPANLELLASVREALDQGPSAAARTIGGGLLLLAPLGVLLPALGRRLGGSRFVSFTRTVFAGAMIALGIQLLVSVAPSRVADVDQVLLGTSGVALAHLLCYGRLRTLLLRAPRPAPARAVPDQEPPRQRGRRARAARGARSAPRAETADRSGPGGPASPDQGPVGRLSQGPSRRTTRVRIDRRTEVLDGSLPVR
jgi:hypothetical protein